MNVTASLSRRNFVAATALALGATLIPGLAFADEKKDSDASEGVDVTGTWVMIGADCDDEDVAALLALITIMATTTYEFKDDGTGTFKIEVVDGSDDMEAAAEEATGETAADAQAEEGDLLQDSEQKIAWEVASDTELSVETEDGTASTLKLDGLSLVEVEKDEDSGMEITSVFARPEDVLSGAWAIATYPDTYDAKHEGIEGSWSIVALEGMGENEYEDAKWSALMGLLGMAVQMDVNADGTFTFTVQSDADTDPDVSEGQWEEKAADTYTFDVDSDPIEVKIVDGTMRLESDGYKMVLAPLA